MSEAELPRKLRLFSLTNIVIGDMIGAGIFTTSGLLLAQLHDPLLLLLLWVVGGAIALSGALSYGELGAKFPSAGGDYIFLTRLFSPLTGFLSGWVSFLVGFSAPVAASSLAFAEYLVRTLPEEVLPPQLELTKKMIAVAIILAFTMIHYFGLRAGSRVQNTLTVLKIGLILILIFTGFVFGEGSFDHFHIEKGEDFSGASLKTIGLSLMWILFAYSGWNASTYVGSEVQNPMKNIPRSLIIGTFTVTAIYLLLNVLYVYAVPPDDMKGVISIGGLTANNLFNRSLDQLFSLFIALILLSAISVLIIIGPRVYYAMAQSGHFFGLAKRINRSKVPGISILLQSGLAIIYVVSGTFDQIITFLSFSLGIFPILAVIGVFKLRISRQTALKIPGYPVLPAFFILTSLGILILAFLERPVESSIALAVIVAGIPMFFWLINNHRKASQKGQ
ncbi:MAG: amino acid permease [Bacteroidales bacterium]